MLVATFVTAVLMADATLVDAIAVIGGGGVTPEDGRAALDVWNEDEKRWAEMALAFPAGWPRLAVSDEIVGLKPGFHVALLALCEPADARRVTALLQSIVDGAYTRPVRVPRTSLACPKVALQLPDVRQSGLENQLELVVTQTCMFRTTCVDTEDTTYRVRLGDGVVVKSGGRKYHRGNYCPE